MTALCDFVFDLFDPDNSRDEKAGCDRSDRHHDGVCIELAGV